MTEQEPKDTQRIFKESPTVPVVKHIVDNGGTGKAPIQKYIIKMLQWGHGDSINISELTDSNGIPRSIFQVTREKQIQERLARPFNTGETERLRKIVETMNPQYKNSPISPPFTKEEEMILGGSHAIFSWVGKVEQGSNRSFGLCSFPKLMVELTGGSYFPYSSGASLFLDCNWQEHK